MRGWIPCRGGRGAGRGHGRGGSSIRGVGLKEEVKPELLVIKEALVAQIEGSTIRWTRNC